MGISSNQAIKVLSEARAMLLKSLREGGYTSTQDILSATELADALAMSIGALMHVSGVDNHVVQ